MRFPGKGDAPFAGSPHRITSNHNKPPPSNRTGVSLVDRKRQTRSPSHARRTRTSLSWTDSCGNSMPEEEPLSVGSGRYMRDTMSSICSVEIIPTKLLRQMLRPRHTIAGGSTSLAGICGFKASSKGMGSVRRTSGAVRLRFARGRGRSAQPNIVAKRETTRDAPVV